MKLYKMNIRQKDRRSFLCASTFSKGEVFDEHFVVGIVSAFEEGVDIFLCRIRVLENRFLKVFTVSRTLKVEHDLCYFPEWIQGG